MKKFPYPDKEIKTVKQAEEHIVELVYNAMSWLRIDGYNFYITTPKEYSFVEREGSGIVITTEYPYKKFHISLQQDSIDKMLKAKKDAAVWINIEKSIMHEMFHLVLHRLTAMAHKRFLSPSEVEDTEEYLVDHLVSVFYPYMENSRKK